MVFRVLARAFRVVRGPFRRPLEPLLWFASVVSVRRVWDGGDGARGARRAALDARLATMHPARRAMPLLAVLAQWTIDGHRWQVVPAYIGTGLCMTVSAAGNALPLWARRLCALSGGATTFASVASGLLIPVFRMPRPTGPHKVGKKTMMWIDRSRKNWLLNTKGRGAFPEHRVLMTNVWYPACDVALKRVGKKHRRANWLEPLLAKSLAVSFWAPEWCVNYFRLVRMHALEDAPVAEGGPFPVLMFSHSFSGMKEQNSALLQELASWGYIVLSVDHPHDAALVLYPDGSTADFRGYDMPNDASPYDWWKFRNQHLRWRVLDCKYALDRMTEMNENPNSDFFGRLDFGRVAAMGHSFGGAAVGMLAQTDARIQCCVMLDPWMWPFGYDRMKQGIPCPLLVFEAPRFLGNRDIFCISNSEMTSTLCAQTAAAATSTRGDEREPHRLSDVFEAVAEDERSESEDEKSSSSVDSLDAFQRRDIPTSPERPTSPGNLPPRPPRRSTGADSSDGHAVRRSNPDARAMMSMSRNSSWGSFMSADEQREPSGVAFKAVIEETMHFDFTDLAMVAPLTTRLLGVVAVGGYEVHEITAGACARFLHAYNRPRNFEREHIFSADELDAQARCVYPGPWPGCPYDKKNGRANASGGGSDVERRTTPLKRMREELAKPRPSGWEKKGGICRWIPTREFRLDAARPWTDEQNREIRWLCHETEDQGVKLTDLDFHCMFPTRAPASSREAVKAFRESDETFPPPAKLAWLSQALLDGEVNEPDYESFRP